MTNQDTSPANAGKQIRSKLCPICFLCGTAGRPASAGLRDRLFSAPGEWSLSECPNPACGLYWLNPMPEEADVALAYRSYYTHEREPAAPMPASRRRFRTWFGALYHLTMDLTGTTRTRQASADSYLAGIRPGELIEVGCGDGSRLLRLKDLGWKVEGQDLDPAAAVHRLSAGGVRVYSGPLDSLKLPEARFDAVVMNHVVEHATDPVALLQECRRILKPGGTLIAVTPNSRGLGHRLFGAHWMPLDPPRHLHLFSPRNLATIARQAGFELVTVMTSAANAEGVGAASWDIRQRGHHDLAKAPTGVAKLIGIGFQILASVAVGIARNSGEEAILRASK